MFSENDNDKTSELEMLRIETKRRLSKYYTAYHGIFDRFNKPKDSMLSMFLKHYGFTRSIIDSYNYFVMHEIPNTFNGIVFNLPNGKVYLCNVRVMKPSLYKYDNEDKPLYPSDALLRNLNYSAPIVADAYFESNNSENQFNKHLHNRNTLTICEIPVLKHSVICNLYGMTKEERIRRNECEFDIAPYFIIQGKDKGSEKTILPQERMCGNIINCFQNKHLYSVEIRCAAINSIPKRTSITYVEKGFGDGPWILRISNSCELNVAVALHVLGFDSRMILPRIFTYIVYKRNFNNEQLQYIWRMLNNLLERQIEVLLGMENNEAIERYLAKRMNYEYLDIMNDGIKRNIYAKVIEDTCSHIKSTDSNGRQLKAELLILMWSKLAEMVIKLPENAKFFLYNHQQFLRIPDDRDNYANKRNDMPGTLLSVLLHQLKSGFVKETQLAIDKDKSAVHPIEKVNKNKATDKVKKNIEYCMSTGNWGIKGSKSSKVGISQQVSSISIVAKLTHVKRVNSNFDKTGKTVKPRMVNTSQYGMKCPNETPEGAACGLVKNPTILQQISVYHDPIIIIEYVKHEIIPISVVTTNLMATLFTPALKPKANDFSENPGIYTNYMPFFCNGVMLGWCAGWKTRAYLCKLRRQKYLHHDVSIYINIDFELHVNSEAGRCMRPFYILENNQLLFEKDGKYKLDKSNGHVTFVGGKKERPATFIELEEMGYIEYLDGYELDSFTSPTTMVTIAMSADQLVNKNSVLPRV